MKYGYTKKIALSFGDAVNMVKEKLSKEGFGVLTEIDVKATLKNKLGVDYDNYVILGACNPQLAYRALTLEKEVGLMLPCNVILYEKNKEVFASAILPTVAMGEIDNIELVEVAQIAEGKLKKAIDNI